MAEWTTPITWADDTTLTAALMNAQVTENQLRLRYPKTSIVEVTQDDTVIANIPADQKTTSTGFGTQCTALALPTWTFRTDDKFDVTQIASIGYIMDTGSNCWADFTMGYHQGGVTYIPGSQSGRKTAMTHVNSDGHTIAYGRVYMYWRWEGEFTNGEVITPRIYWEVNSGTTVALFGHSWHMMRELT